MHAAPKPYVPQPWVAGKSYLQTNYRGIDVKWLYRLVSKNSVRLVKSEFETFKEYEERILQYASLPPPLTADQEYAFRMVNFELEHNRPRYNAEREEFFTQHRGMMCPDADKKSDSGQTLVVCDVSDIEMHNSYYVASNAYGVKINVQRIRGHSFGLAIDKEDPFSKQFLWSIRGFQDSFAVPRERALLLDGKVIGLLFVGTLQDGRLITGRPTIITPTIDNKSDFLITSSSIKFRPTRIVYFIVETGEILLERSL